MIAHRSKPTIASTLRRHPSLDELQREEPQQPLPAAAVVTGARDAMQKSSRCPTAGRAREGRSRSLGVVRKAYSKDPFMIRSGLWTWIKSTETENESSSEEESDDVGHADASQSDPGKSDVGEEEEKDQAASKSRLQRRNRRATPAKLMCSGLRGGEVRATLNPGEPIWMNEDMLRLGGEPSSQSQGAGRKHH